MTEYYIEIRELNNGQVVETKGPYSERRADRIDGGININLNHDKYYTVIKEATND